MKYSNYIGVAAAAVVVILCFMPWVQIRSLNITLSGINGYVTPDLNFGKQVFPHALFSLLMTLCFLTSRLWAKRTNVFLGAIHLSWAFKNYLVFSACRSIECPDVKPSLYLLLVFTFITLVMSLLPKGDLQKFSAGANG